MADVLHPPLLQVIDLRVLDSLWEIAHIPLQGVIHQLKAAKQKLQVTIRRRDLEPLADVRERGTGVTIQSDLEGILNLKAFSCQYTSTLTNP